MTMSYRLDSDIVWPYGRVYEIGPRKIQVAPSQYPVKWKTPPEQPKDSALRKNLKKFFDQKSVMAAWVVSNCNDDPSERMELVKSLQKFIKVDIYGKCGLKCKDCFGQLRAKYFFYFAFENSLATDYVSEKMYNALENYAIPVVYGGADYTKFLPTKSYIEAQKFNSTKALAEFLTKLSQNEEEYFSYHLWRTNYEVNIGSGYADLCTGVMKARRQFGKKVQFYSDLKRWEHEGTWLNRTIEIS